MTSSWRLPNAASELEECPKRPRAPRHESIGSSLGEALGARQSRRGDSHAGFVDGAAAVDSREHRDPAQSDFLGRQKFGVLPLPTTAASVGEPALAARRATRFPRVFPKSARFSLGAPPGCQSAR